MVLVASLAAATMLPREAVAQIPVINREYSIKAAFLYRFFDYITWPPAAFIGADDSFVIGVNRANPFRAKLPRIADAKRIGDRSIEFAIVANPDKCCRCDILFVPSSVPVEETARILKAVKDTAVLVVDEPDGFVHQGGDSQFFLENNKLRFACRDVSAATISDQLNASKRKQLVRIADMLDQHQDELGEFMVREEKGRQIPRSLRVLHDSLQVESAMLGGEADSLVDHVEHTKAIGASQQSYAGTIALVEQSDERRMITLRTDVVDERFIIEVSDTGVGVCREGISRIFSHGFGLPSCANAAHEMDGELNASSDGRMLGATFRLSLPLSPLVAAV